jgi:hypothetical protein
MLDMTPSPKAAAVSDNANSNRPGTGKPEPLDRVPARPYIPAQAGD